MRNVPEWIGKTDDTPVPKRVKIRVFIAHDGICHISKRKIVVGDKWDAEHVKAISNGGENRESNLAPALIEPHKIKTKRDRAIKSKTDRMRAMNLGLNRSKRTIPGRRFNGDPIPARLR